MSEVTLDTGALIALERGNPTMLALLMRVRQGAASVSVPANVVAQAWRGTRRQARLAMLLGSQRTEIVNVDFSIARKIGEMCGAAGVPDVVDVSVVICAQERNHGVITSDPDDLHTIDPKAPLLTV